MSIVKTGINRLNILDQIQLTRTVVTKMTGNANFTTPSPGLPALTTAANELETANNAAVAARVAAKLATSTQVDKQAILVGLLNQEAAYVQNLSAGDRTKIESSGFGVKNGSVPSGTLPAPASVSANTNTDPGTMEFSWSTVRGARSYALDRAPDGPAPLVWTTVAVPTTRKVLVNSMTSGARYWFRVAAVNAAGMGFFTDPIAKIAP